MRERSVCLGGCQGSLQEFCAWNPKTEYRASENGGKPTNHKWISHSFPHSLIHWFTHLLTGSLTNRGTRGKKIANKIFIISSYLLHGLIDISKTRHFRRNNYHQVMFDIIVEVVFDTVVTTFQLSFVNVGLTRSIHLFITKVSRKRKIA